MYKVLAIDHNGRIVWGDGYSDPRTAQQMFRRVLFAYAHSIRVVLSHGGRTLCAGRTGSKNVYRTTPEQAMELEMFTGFELVDDKLTKRLNGRWHYMLSMYGDGLGNIVLTKKESRTR